jgi:glucose-1-phosphate cytidylyltransferase
MKAVILAGGFGTRISEESGTRPKPMVEIGGKPILWHVMKIYSAYGINDFIICCGYKGHIIKDYFANYGLHSSDVTFNLRTGATIVHQNAADPWNVTLVDTGERTMTGGRIKRVAQHIGDETFCLTYGDGVANVDIARLIDHHRRGRGWVTLTAVQPEGRFGIFALDEGQSRIAAFREKPKGDGEGAWINGGFFVVEPQALDCIDGDETVWELEPLERLARDGLLSAFRHDGFWQAMDTLRDKHVLEDLWQSGSPPWKVW